MSALASRFNQWLLKVYIRLSLAARTHLLAIGAVVVLLSLVPGTASAHPVRSKLRIDAFGIVYRDGSYEYDFVGLVGARGHHALSCFSGRRVTFYRDVTAGSDHAIGSDRTNGYGLAILTLKHPDLDTLPGRYYAVVDSARKRTRSGRVRCGGDRSNEIDLKAPSFYHPKAGATPAEARSRELGGS
jgi:hypothetical protein